MKSKAEVDALKEKVKHIYDAAASKRTDTSSSASIEGIPEDNPVLSVHVEEHIRYLCKDLQRLDSSYVTLDASRPWLLYWILHGLSLLGVNYDVSSGKLKAKSIISNALEQVLREAPSRIACIKFLSTCQNPTGGFGGGPQQLSHIATTYAAVAALLTIGGKDALGEIDREKIGQFIQRLQVNEGQYLGAFRVHVGGEIDIRASYLAMALLKMLDLKQDSLNMETMVHYIKRCQTYEGGFGGEPGNEAHGGYSYCAFAALALAQKEKAIDLLRLLDWTSNRQSCFEGGFNGRTNKLVDSCYSFWNGGLLCLVQNALQSKGFADTPARNLSFLDLVGLHRWILICCQMDQGGLVDKPGKRPDFYHTCYSLSGLSSSLYCTNEDSELKNFIQKSDLLCNVTCEKLNAAYSTWREM